MKVTSVIRRPVITEKSARGARGLADHRFEVARNATKVDVGARSSSCSARRSPKVRTSTCTER